MAARVLRDILTIEVDHGGVVDTAEPQHHPGVLPAWVNIELGIVPGPPNVISKLQTIFYSPQTNISRQGTKEDDRPIYITIFKNIVKLDLLWMNHLMVLLVVISL